jgi:electron transfer flavoprotein alpha subunit
VTVLCLAELDGKAVADVSLRALTFARVLAGSVATPATASAASAAPSASTTPPKPPAQDEASAWMYQRSRPGGRNSTSMVGDAGAGEAGAGGGEGGVRAAGPDGRVAAVVFGSADGVPVGELSAYGVADAYTVESPQLTGYAPQAWARALAELAEEVSAAAVVAAGTDRGHEVLAHLGAITGLPMAANCASAEANADRALRLVRHRWAGSLLEDAVLDAAPALLTVAVDAVTPAAADAFVATSVHAWQPALGEADLRVVAVESAERSGGASLATARVVVGGGRGVGGPEGFGALEELAGLLGGVVGVSRVVTSEGWRPHKQQVGQTGTRISPELYLACGISGAIQHMAGCLSAKHIVAVNTDPDAPIISHADYAVIGDLREVIPALVAAIRARDGS